MLIGACKPPEPTPTLYTDLGTEDQPLPPPAQAWYDPAVAKGTAEWKPFRKPEEGKSAEAKPKGSTNKPSAEPDAAGDAPEAEKEIRDIAADFNAALATNKLEDALDFLTDAQAEAARDVLAAVHALIEQLKALQAAAPALSEKINGLVPLLNLGDALKFEIRKVNIVNDTTAMAQLEGGGEAKFVMGEEDLWYLESPVFGVLIQQRERIETTAKSIEEALAKGEPDEATTTALGTALEELRAALSSDAKPEGDSG